MEESPWWHPELCGHGGVTLVAPRAVWAWKGHSCGTQSSVGMEGSPQLAPRALGDRYQAHSQPSGAQDLLPHPPSQCQAVTPGISQFLCPQVKGVRAGWGRAEALPAPPLTASITILGEPWAGAALAVPSLAPWLSVLTHHSQMCCGNEFLPRSHVPTSHPCSACQSQHTENLCGFGDGLLSSAPGDTSYSSRSLPAPALGMALLAHCLWLLLVLLRALSLHNPYLGYFGCFSPSPV